MPRRLEQHPTRDIYLPDGNWEFTDMTVATEAVTALGKAFRVKIHVDGCVPAKIQLALQRLADAEELREPCARFVGKPEMTEHDDGKGQAKGARLAD